MNRQDKVKEYDDYGFTTQEIAKELNMSIALVRAALDGSESKKIRTDTPAKSIKHRTKMHASTLHLEMYEILYKYGPRYLNKIIKDYGLRTAATFIGVKHTYLYALKLHFGYDNHLPMNALDRITYFSESLRQLVDKRDSRICIRCDRVVKDKYIRYHKITHPGPMEVDNCVTICYYCRLHYLLPSIAANPKSFFGFRYPEMRAWIRKYIPCRFGGRKKGSKYYES